MEENMNPKPQVRKCDRCDGPIETIIEKQGKNPPTRIALHGGVRGNFLGDPLYFQPASGGDNYLCPSCWGTESLVWETNRKLSQQRYSEEAEKARLAKEERMADEKKQKADEKKARELYRQSLWIEFYPKNGNTTRLEGIKHARINGQWINVMALDGIHACFHCESFKTNLAPDDWVGGCNVPQYDERYHGKGYSKMPERFPDKETDDEEPESRNSYSGW
jgi:hypothetical protein